MKNKEQHPPFRRVILYARQYRANQGVIETLERLVFLLTEKGFDVYQDQDTLAHFELDIPVLNHQDLNSKTDIICVVGGDGSLLSAARMAVHHNVAVIGINRGRLGFLTDIAPHDIDHQLLDVLQGHYIEEERFLLETSIPSPHEPLEGLALNDVLLSRGTQNHLIEFDVYVNQELMSHYRSDGLIISTPTGSTAYALSAGGPIMHPGLNAIVLVPMFSHSLNSRPMVIDANVQLTLKIAASNQESLKLSSDGHDSFNVKPGQEITLRKYKKTLRLLHPVTYHYYDTLRQKLGWQTNHQG